MPVQKKGGLGKGLNALFSEMTPLSPVPAADPAESPKDTPAEGGPQILEIDINDITPNRNQPRRVFDEEKLAELADSIRAHGLIQPIIVQRIDGGYEIVAGERRWRACRLADCKTVPCILREYSEQDNMLVALIENLQREDLNPMEEAEAFARLVEEQGMTHEAISESIGRAGGKKSRSYVTNTLRLRELPEKVQSLIARRQLSAGHGRALLQLDTPELQAAAAEKVLTEGLSVRQTEELVKHFALPKGPADLPSRGIPSDSYQMVEEELKELLGAKVRIREKNHRGNIQLSFYSREELSRLIDLLSSIKIL